MSPAPYARAALWVFLAFLILYVGVTRGHFVGTDEIAVYQATRSLWEEGSLATGRILNTFPGRGGRVYGQYGAGQSVAALPLYGVGKTLGRALDRAGLGDWVATFAGPSVGSEPSRWGGDIEIFFVNLFNCVTTALLCALFFVFSLRLGGSPRRAFAAAVLLGLTSYVAPFSTGFLQHSSEALLLLWAFYLLFSDSRQPAWRTRAWAGIAVALMLLFRLPSLIAVPGLGLYLLWSVERRAADAARPRSLLARLREGLPFVAPIAAGLALHLVVNYVKFGHVRGEYNNEGFHTPVLKGLSGFLVSPGDSIFLFTPLLLLMPWTLRLFARRYRAEAWLILGLAASYLVFYGHYTAWHGLWSALGPRYLVPIVPLLLLPLAGWMEHRRRAAWLVVGLLTAAGFWAQLVHVAVNFAYVYHHERYPEFRPSFEFLFVPRMAPILAHSRALLAADYRVDMWLVNVYRAFGLGRLITLAIPLGVLLLACGWRLRRELRAAEAAWTPGVETPLFYRLRPVIALLALLCAGTAGAWALDRDRGGRPPGFAGAATGVTDAEGELMRSGLDLLFGRQDPAEAAVRFRQVLERNPTHYGATYQLAVALDRGGRRAEARAVWERVLRMAEGHGDATTAATARARLSEPS